MTIRRFFRVSDASKRKMREWKDRYLLAECIGLVLALLSSYACMRLFGNIVVSGIVGTWAENVGFYGTILFRDLRARAQKGKLTFHDYWRQCRNIVVEFGPAEYLDSFLIRPAYLSVLPYFIAPYPLAIFIGTLLANVTFYIPTILAYEYRKKHLEE